MSEIHEVGTLTDAERSAAVASFTTALARTGRLIDMVMHAAALRDAMGPDTPPEMEASLKGAISEALLGLPDKVDSVAFVIEDFRLKKAAALAELASYQDDPKLKRLMDRAERCEREALRVEEYALDCIKMLGLDDKGKYTKLEGTTVTFQANKLAPTCEVYDESLIPREFKKAIVSNEWPLTEWIELTLNSESSEKIIDVVWNVSYSIDRKALLAALKSPCEKCGGTGEREVISGTAEEMERNGEPQPCPKCNGKGTRLVPGARLITGRATLKLK